MSGKKRISLSPVLKQHKFIFDLMKNTTSDFTFMMDPAADIFLLHRHSSKHMASLQRL